MNNYIIKSGGGYHMMGENAIYYESGYDCDNAILLSLGSEKTLITDARYYIEAKEIVQGIGLICVRDIEQEANRILKESSIKDIELDPLNFTLQSFHNIFDSLAIDIKQTKNFLQQKRVIKSSKEIEILSQSSQMGKRAFSMFGEFLKDSGFGLSEKELFKRAKEFLSYQDEYPLSFDPIVAINQNGAKAHATPTELKLSKGDLLLIDAGLKYRRYCSDRTVTISADRFDIESRDQKFDSSEMQRVYDTVLKAQQSAIEKARSGMKAKEIDKIARDVIDKVGYGKEFIHSTGHGIGLDIHELPVISSKSETVVEDGMVFTVEPGIYLANRFGIRIEDMVVMRNGRAEIL
jgi:Xaa-Pro aminopeptidase